MFDPSSFVDPTLLVHADASRDVLPRGGTSQLHPTRFNLYDPEMRNTRGFNVWPEVYFSGSENVTEFLEGHLLGRALDLYQIFGLTLVQNTATDFAQLKAALSKAFPAIQNKKELETRFYASQQRRNKEQTDFVYDLLKLHKKLELGMSEKALVEHIFVRLEPQVQDYIEVRNPRTAIQLLEVLAKFEERYSCKATLGSRNSNNMEGRGRNERRMSNVGNNRGNWRHSEVVHRPNNGRNDYRRSNQNRQENQWFESRNRFQNDDRRFNDRGYQFRNRGQNDNFSRGDQRNRGSSENFSRGSRKQMGRLNVLKVNDIKGDQTQSINQSPIKLSAICMSPVELPYVPILLDETFTKALWDTGAEKSFISEETYQKYFFYKQVKKSSTQCCGEELHGDRERECLAVVWALNKFRTYLGSLPIKVITDHAALTHLTTGKNLSNRMIRWALKLAEFNIEWEHRPETQNTIADVLSRNPFESIIGEKVNCAIIRDLVLSSRDQLIEEQKTYPELGHIYRYLENPEDSSVNAAISSARVIADNFFDNYISRFGAPIKLISDNGPQFISDIFESLSERLGIRHVKTVVYRPQANGTERVNRDLVQMIANYVNEQHDTWDQFLREFAYAIRTAVNETTGKTPAELFLGRKLITPFQKLVMVSDGTEFAVGGIERLFEEARRNTETKHEKWKKYYNRRRHGVQTKVNDRVLVATHPLSSATRKVVAKFKPKFEGPYRVLDVKNNNVVIWKAGKMLTINVDQVRIYRHRKCDETEIGAGSSDNGSLRDESRGFDRVQRRSNDSRDGKKKGSEVRRTREESSEHRAPKRALSSNYRTNHSLTKFRKKSRREETVTPTTSGYKLRPRIGKREESRPTIERKTQQGRPVRSRKGRERNDSPYIEERTRSSNKNARRGEDQQRQDQERRGTCTKKSLSLEVLVGNANCKS
ncbi:uncharacterized protein TNCV_1308431 [Trichonephila clavipes]|nr:uncharacterized protein TNCV_1308431 [Trichonephila clavipes]